MKSSRTHSAFTLVELLIAIGVIALLAAILIPVVASSRRSATRSACLSNIRQIGAAVLQYTQDYDGTFPTISHSVYRANGTEETKGTPWQEMVVPYVGRPFPICPSNTVPEFMPQNVNRSGYAINVDLNEQITITGNKIAFLGRPEATAGLTSLVVLICEAAPPTTGINGPDNEAETFVHSGTGEEVIISPGATRHEGGANYAFVDGHAKWFRPDAFADPCDGVKPCFRKP